MGAPELESMYRRWLSICRSDVARELMADDLIDHNPYPGQPPGLEGHNWAVAMVRRAFPDLRFTADVVVEDGECLAGRWTMTGTNTGTFDLFGLPPTGRPVTMTGRRSSARAMASSPRSGTRRTSPACSASSAWSLRRLHAPGRPAQRTPLPAAVARRQVR